MDLWAQNVKRGLEGQEGPVMVAQKKGLTSDKLCDTHKFQGLLSASQYKRRREDVLDEVALTDSDVTLSKCRICLNHTVYHTVSPGV